MTKAKTFRDPVYDYILCSEDEVKIIDSPWFQRLRHCSQNGPAKLVYPTLFGSRFEHSLGVMHLAEKMLRSVLDRAKYEAPTILDEFLYNALCDINIFCKTEKVKTHEDVKNHLIYWVRLAGLCHDLAHFPLSHTLEVVFDERHWEYRYPEGSFNTRACHEVISAEFIRQIAYSADVEYRTPANERIITELDARAIIILLLLPDNLIINNKPIESTFFSTLHSIIVGSYDADRLDYLQRDAHLASASFGLIDIERFLDSLIIEKCNVTINGSDIESFVIMPTSKAVSAIETIFLERYKSKKWVHFHHKVVFYDKMVMVYAHSLFDKKDDEYFFKDIGNISGLAKDALGKWNDEDYYKEILFCLSGESDNPNEAVPPLCIFENRTQDGWRIIDCTKFINNEESRYIDDIWFSQLCRKTSEQKSDEEKLLIDTLVDRKATGLTVWKTPDVFYDFWTEVSTCIEQSDRFWKILGITNKMAAQGKGYCIRERLEEIFRDERDEIYKFLGQKRPQLIQCIEKELTKDLKICEQFSVQVKMAYVRWKNLFFDKIAANKSNHVKCSHKGPCRLDAFSGLIQSLMGLRGEILFYIYFWGEEKSIARLNEEFENNKSKIISDIAKKFADTIISLLSVYCPKLPKNASMAKSELKLSD